MSPSCVGGQSALQYHTQPWLQLKRKARKNKQPKKLKRYAEFPSDTLSSVPSPSHYDAQYRADQPKSIKVKRHD